MFAMMNSARLAVGLQGVAIAERATQQALSYARERRQGANGKGGGGGMVPIAEHPDVRRMLLTMKGLTQAARGICHLAAVAIDRAHHAPNEEERRQADERAALLTPVAKAFSTDAGDEVASIGVQVHGGMGYIEETGAAQYMRDSRIAAIYEGANGIQAIDLVQRGDRRFRERNAAPPRSPRRAARRARRRCGLSSPVRPGARDRVPR
jgi:alkylation response protein AidB-like acyl-CoA dehydrogenase